MVRVFFLFRTGGGFEVRRCAIYASHTSFVYSFSFCLRRSRTSLTRSSQRSIPKWPARRRSWRSRSLKQRRGKWRRGRRRRRSSGMYCYFLTDGFFVEKCRSLSLSLSLGAQSSCSLSDLGCATRENRRLDRHQKSASKRNSPLLARALRSIFCFLSITH